MAGFYIKRPDGRGYNMWGWVRDAQHAMHYRTEADAKDELDKQRSAFPEGCTVEKVPPRLDPGMTKLDKPIFSGGVHG